MTEERFTQILTEEGYLREEIKGLLDARPAELNLAEVDEDHIRSISRVMLPAYQSCRPKVGAK